MSFKVLDIEALKKAPLQTEPFPYLIIDHFIHRNFLSGAVQSFPTLDSRGSFSLNVVSCQGVFAELMEEMQRPELRDLIGAKFAMDLKDKPTMITLRGHTTERDGHIHADSESKLITLLLYLNPNWRDSGGQLRLLYNQRDLNHFFAEIPPEAGKCLIFKVTPNCWHGHEVFIGERKSIQLNYVSSEKQRERQIKRHRFSAFLKRLFFKKNEANSPY